MGRAQKKKSPKSKPGNSARKEFDAQETQAAEFLTVIWSLTVLTGFVCGLGAAITRLASTQETPRLAMLSGLLFFAAATIGVVSLVVLPLVLRARKVPPPRGFIVFALLVAIAPLIAIAAQMFLG